MSLERHEISDAKRVDLLQMATVTLPRKAYFLPEPFRGFPAFLNFAFDSRDLICVWLSQPALAHTPRRGAQTTRASRRAASAAPTIVSANNPIARAFSTAPRLRMAGCHPPGRKRSTSEACSNTSGR